MNSNYSLPVNLGNPDEYTVEQLARIVRDKIGNNNQIVYKDKVTDDPMKRKPDISRAKQYLNWSPKFKLSEGLERTIAYFRQELNKNQNTSTHNPDLYLNQRDEL